MGRVKIELSPLVVDVVVEPMGVPPVHAVERVTAWHKVQLTVPVGGPPTELPSTVAVSPQVLPRAVLVGAMTVEVKPGSTGSIVTGSDPGPMHGELTGPA